MLCHKLGFFHTNMKNARNIAVERNSGNSTPTIDIEPKNRTFYQTACPVSDKKFCYFTTYLFSSAAVFIFFTASAWTWVVTSDFRTFYNSTGFFLL